MQRSGASSPLPPPLLRPFFSSLPLLVRFILRFPLFLLCMLPFLFRFFPSPSLSPFPSVFFLHFFSPLFYFSSLPFLVYYFFPLLTLLFYTFLPSLLHIPVPFFLSFAPFSFSLLPPPLTSILYSFLISASFIFRPLPSF